MTVRFLDVGATYRELKPVLDQAIARVLESGDYILGEEGRRFESEFARFVNTSHCVSVGSGLDALSLILRALGIGEGHEVIVPAHTFIATWLAVTHAGATPVPVDVTEESFNLDPAQVEAAVTSRTRAVLAVHLYGRMAPVSELRQATGSEIALIEDAAQAHGASSDDAAAGSVGVAAGWSFYPGKNLGAFGDGGAITTNDSSLAAEVRRLRNYGSERKYVHEVAGQNSRLDEVQAAVLRAKLPELAAWNDRRSAIAGGYLSYLQNRWVTLPGRGPGRPSWHIFCIRSPRRDLLAAHLEKRGVQTLIHYPVPPYRQAAYKSARFDPADFPATELLCGEILSLPIGPHMDDASVTHVIDAVNDFPG